MHLLVEPRTCESEHRPGRVHAAEARDLRAKERRQPAGAAADVEHGIGGPGSRELQDGIPLALEHRFTQAVRPAKAVPSGRTAVELDGALYVSHPVLCSFDDRPWKLPDYAARPASWYTKLWPDAPAERVAALAQRDPSALVLSDDRYADWLLWAEPQLRGRVAYDVRFELFAGKQFDELFRYRNQVGDDWRRAQAGYDILALARPDEELVIRAVRGRGGYRLVYESGLIAVLQRR